MTTTSHPRSGGRLVRLGRRASPLLLAPLAILLGGCGNTVQDQPIPHNILESLLVAPYPVYWVGGSFKGLQITEAARDPGGASSIQYGDCLEGGQGVCVPPLRVVTSPDNSFLPGGSAPRATAEIRGVTAVAALGGRVIEVPTGRVVVDVYARNPQIAGAAAQEMVPISAGSAPYSPLPPPLPDSGFAAHPLPIQLPPPIRRLR